MKAVAGPIQWTMKKGDPAKANVWLSPITCISRRSSTRARTAEHWIRHLRTAEHTKCMEASTKTPNLNDHTSLRTLVYGSAYVAHAGYLLAAGFLQFRSGDLCLGTGIMSGLLGYRQAVLITHLLTHCRVTLAILAAAILSSPTSHAEITFELN